MLYRDFLHALLEGISPCQLIYVKIMAAAFAINIVRQVLRDPLLSLPGLLQLAASALPNPTGAVLLFKLNCSNSCLSCFSPQLLLSELEPDESLPQ